MLFVVEIVIVADSPGASVVSEKVTGASGRRPSVSRLIGAGEVRDRVHGQADRLRRRPADDLRLLRRRAHAERGSAAERQPPGSRVAELLQRAVEDLARALGRRHIPMTEDVRQPTRGASGHRVRVRPDRERVEPVPLGASREKLLQRRPRRRGGVFVAQGPSATPTVPAL